MTDIVIGRGVIDAAAVIGGRAPALVPIITQPGASGVARALARSIEESGSRPEVLTLPDGEDAKTLGVVEESARWLSGLGIRRDGLVVAVGGGALTDVAGFVAGVYLRGVAAHYVSTTLLGAVDASIGGKTGVNVDGKNVLGVFRQPRRVVIDLDVLDALPVPEKRNGFAEALKAGLVGDPALVSVIEAGGLRSDLEEVVRRAVHVKQGIVERDFEETGERAHLNYGHTIGHAVESATGMAHGEAVAVGMVAAGRVSALLAGFDDERRQGEIIASLGLPTAVEHVDADLVNEFLARDKKHDERGLRMVVLERIGAPRVVHVDGATVREALASVGIAEGDR
jgi:3-dehydroquinate synthetase